MQKTRHRFFLDFILRYIFVYSAFIDMINAWVQRVAKSETLLVNAYKGGAILLMLCYLLHLRRVNKFIYMFLALLFLYFLCFSYWAACGYFDRFTGELSFGLKIIIYPYLLVLFILSARKYIKPETLVNYVIIYACLFPFSFAANLFTDKGFGYYSGNALSFAGLVLSGNDWGVAMLITNCLACYMFYHTSKKRYALASLVITVMTMLLGSVAGVLGSAAIIFCFVLHAFFVQKLKLRIWQKLYIAALLVAGIPAVIGAVYFIITFSQFTADKFNAARILSGGARNWLETAARKNLKTYSIADFIFGRGVENVWAAVGSIAGLRAPHSIEIDQYEMISNFGVVLGSLLLLLPVLFTLKLLLRYFRKRTSFYFWSSLAMLFLVIHGFTAGHAFVSILVLQTAAVVYFYWYSIERAGERECLK
jgi:hypothetical protein